MNRKLRDGHTSSTLVSMKSGLEGRNNTGPGRCPGTGARLNEVRPRRPEQWASPGRCRSRRSRCLNEVRPRRPEQWASPGRCRSRRSRCLNEVRPRRPEQYRNQHQPDYPTQVSMKSGLEGRNNDSAVSPTSSISRLNEVRPRRPEQLEPCTGQEYALAYRLNEVRPRRPEQCPADPFSAIK